MRKARGLTEFVRVQLAWTDDGWLATPLPSQSSGVLTALGSGAALLVGPSALDELPAGGRYAVLVLGDETLAREAPPF